MSPLGAISGDAANDPFAAHRRVYNLSSICFARSSPVNGTLSRMRYTYSMPKPLQFRLSTLLIATTIVAILAACTQIPSVILAALLVIIIVMILGLTTFGVLAIPFRKELREDLATGPRIVIGCILVPIILVVCALVLHVVAWMVFEVLINIPQLP
jgi:hypothetical protein